MLHEARRDDAIEVEISERDVAATNQRAGAVGEDPPSLFALFIKRREVGTAGEFDHMSDEELGRYIAEETVALNLLEGGERKYTVD